MAFVSAASHLHSTSSTFSVFSALIAHHGNLAGPYCIGHYNL
nr:MAG TPA: hypothetical protein [Bacteriophage sp.]